MSVLIDLMEQGNLTDTVIRRGSRNLVPAMACLFMACAELFGYNNGNEWFIGHYLLRKISS